MAFREVGVIEIKEILRRWQKKESLRNIAAAVGLDRKTVRRYVKAAQQHGVLQNTSSPISDAVLGRVIAALLPGTPVAVGNMREHCRLHRTLIEEWVRKGCKSPKIGRLLLHHTQVVVPERTLRRFIKDEIQNSVKDDSSVRIVESPPGQVLEIDFMEVGKVLLSGVNSRLFALVCVAACSRHLFVWPCLRTTTIDVIEGLEAAWSFFGGVFPVIVHDNPKAIVVRAHPFSPTFNTELAEYAQARGFVLDPARVRHPRDKHHVERSVSYIRSDGFAAERYLDLDATRKGLAHWCREVAGQRRHGTLRRKPLEVFEAEEKALLLPAPEEPYDVPIWAERKVGSDHAISVGEALYSVPHALRGESLRVRLDRSTVKMYHHHQLVKIHVRVGAGKSSIDPADLPEGLGELATRDANALQRQCATYGNAVGEYARLILNAPQPWMKMRQVYRLLGLCKQYGASPVEQACNDALQQEVIDVQRLAHLLETQNPPDPPPTAKILRFYRDPSEFRRNHA